MSAVHRARRRMRALAALATLALGVRAALAADATVSLVLFDERQPLPEAEVRIDGQPRAKTNPDGVARLDLTPGTHTLTVVHGDETVLSVELMVRADENAEIIATVYPDAAASVFIESSHGATAQAPAQAQQAQGPPGVLEGQVFSAETAEPVAGARVYISGTPLDISTDAEGRWRAELPPGEYSISVIAADYSTQTVDDLAVASEQTAVRNVELAPAGLELPEFVVLEPFVEGSLAAFVEEKRTSAAVADILGAEQISRAGDSDAAAALKRVTGLTLVDGKFVYVRGLGERYSSTLLNGAQIPSPDPTRRVVPLDLFPTEILSGIVVQKTYSADMPGEFGGGTIQLRTRGVPESFFLKVSGTVGYTDGTTGEDGLRYDGGRRDWTGFDQVRNAPAGLLDPRLPTDPQALEALGEAVAAQGYNTRRESLGPNGGFAFGFGDNFVFSDGDWSLGYIAALRYSHEWDSRLEERRFYALSGGQQFPLEDYTREQTARLVDVSGFLSAGLTIGEHHNIAANLIRVRQTTDEVQIDEGLLSSGSLDRTTTLEWIENELVTQQLTGEHSLPALGGLVVGWRYTDASASRDAPNQREYRFTFSDTTEEFDSLSFQQQRWESLEDEAKDYGLDLKYPISLGDADTLTLLAGASQLQRDRVSGNRRFTFLGRRIAADNLEEILNPGTIGPGGVTLGDRTSTSDAYTAEVELDAYYGALDLVWGRWRANAGVREESILQRVVTVDPFNPTAPPIVGILDSKDQLPAGSLTWAYSDAAQLRLGYSKTLSRPDIREQSPANFIDPILDVRVEGNPDLEQAQIENLDLRWEYYFSPTESFSVALFQKDFTNPIELISVPASGTLLNIANATEATNRGIELDLYKSLSFARRWQWLPHWLRGGWLENVYVGANYARIDSEVDLGDEQGIQTNAVRPLQGQSAYVANASLSYLDPEGDVEATLLYNVFGERISQVGVSGKADIYEQPFHQLDFTLSTRLPWEGWKFKAKLKNLLDPEVEFLEGELPTRSYRKGREIGLSLEWSY